jgi:hypothetical protein
LQIKSKQTPLKFFFCDFKTDRPILQFSLFEQNPLLQSSPASCPAIEEQFGTSQSCKKKCLEQFGRRKCSEPHANCAQFGASQRQQQESTWSDMAMVPVLVHLRAKYNKKALQIHMAICT